VFWMALSVKNGTWTAMIVSAVTTISVKLSGLILTRRRVRRLRLDVCDTESQHQRHGDYLVIIDSGTSRPPWSPSRGSDNCVVTGERAGAPRSHPQPNRSVQRQGPRQEMKSLKLTGFASGLADRSCLVAM
jgi:hypothetical protein